MNTFCKLTTVLAATLLCAACSKQDKLPEQSTSVTKITIGLPGTKASLADDNGVYKMVWDEGDILHLGGVASDPVPAKYVGQTSAEFTFPGTAQAPYNLLYCGVDGRDDAVCFPAVQNYVKGSFGKGLTPMYASSDDLSSLQPSALFAAVRFNFTGEQTDAIRSLYLQATGGEILCGEFTVGKDQTGHLNGSVTPSKDNYNSTCLIAGDGVALGSEPSEFFVVIPAGSYSKGFKAYATTAEGKTMELDFLASSSYEILPGKVYNLSVKKFEANSDKVVIASVDDLIMFSSLGGEDNAGVQAMLVSDLDLTGSEYVTFTNFYGKLDGCGHTISGLTSPLFGKLYGEVSNLRLEGDIDFGGVLGDVPGTDYGVGMLCQYIYNSGVNKGGITNVKTYGSVKISGPTKSDHAFQIGGIAGASNGCPLEDCENYATVSVTDGYTVNAHTSGTTVFYLAAGGIVGTCQTSVSASLTNCHNFGAVSVNPALAGDGMYAGGLAGYITVKAEVSECSNEAEVTVSGTSSITAHAGGLIGNAVGQPKLSNCLNKGNVVLSATAGATSYISGLVANCNNSTLNDCRNEGSLQTTAQVKGVLYGGGIAGASIMEKSSNLVNTGDILLGGSANYFFVGGITGYEGAYTLGKVTNSGNITFDGASPTTSTGIAIGGIFGQSKGTNTVNDATNNGNISIVKFGASSYSGLRYDVGGLTGYCYKDDGAATYTYNNCSNNGNITISDISKASDMRIGGLLGNVYIGKVENSAVKYTGNLNVTSCVNNGEITINADQEKNLYAGGICSDIRVYGGKISVKDCYNYKNITVNGKAGSARVSLGGIAAMIYNCPVTAEFSNCHNSGRIGLYENDTDSKRPAAGGILGLAEGQSASVLNLSITGCTNSGNIERTSTAAAGSLSRTGSSGYPYLSVAGGIVGGLGYYYEGGETYCYVNATVQDCTNSAMIQFNRKTGGNPAGTGSPAEKNSEGDNVYCGGIAGIAYASATCHQEIVSCTNTGDILANFGKCGGMVGFQRKNSAIRGVKTADGIKYCVNSGRVGRNPALEPGTAGTAYGYFGGITGYVFGDGSNSIEYCHVTSGCWTSGNYGGGGIVAQLGSSSYPKGGVIRYCKVNACGHASSTAASLITGEGGKCGFAHANAPSSAAFDEVSDIAVGGVVYKYISSKWTEVKATPENFMKYYSATTFSPDTEWAAQHNVAYWDGTSKTSWE